MGKPLFIFFLILVSINCQDQGKKLTLVENDQPINLRNLENVRETINGFWMIQGDLQNEEILWLGFGKQDNKSTWEMIPYNPQIQRTKIIPMKSCPTVATLLRIDNSIVIEFVSLGGSDTVKIDYLSTNRFEINGRTYLRHKGYNFLEDWPIEN